MENKNSKQLTEQNLKAINHLFSMGIDYIAKVGENITNNKVVIKDIVELEKVVSEFIEFYNNKDVCECPKK